MLSAEIKEILRNDCKKFKKMKSLAEKKIVWDMQRIRWSFTSGRNTFNQFASSANYLSHIRNSYNQYKKNFINPDLTKLLSMKELFGGRDGDT